MRNAIAALLLLFPTSAMAAPYTSYTPIRVAPIAPVVRIAPVAPAVRVAPVARVHPVVHTRPLVGSTPHVRRTHAHHHKPLHIRLQQCSPDAEKMRGSEIRQGLPEEVSGGRQAAVSSAA